MRIDRSDPARTSLIERLERRVFLNATALGDLHLSDLPDQHNATTSVNIGGTQYFAVEPAQGIAGASAELWKSDGTLGGTSRVHTFNLLGAYVSSDAPPISNLANVDGELFFTVKSAANQTQLELWKSDGTDAGTMMVASGFGTPAVGLTMNFTDVNGTLFFTAGSGLSFNLWKSDGTSQGTTQLTTSAFTSVPANLTNVNGKLYFTSGGLWTSNGTTASTQLVKSLSTTDTSSIQQLGSKFYFVANAVLYSSDGTGANTQPLITNNPPSVGEIRVAGTRLYFAATDSTNGKELWSSDGTTGNASLVKDIRSGSSSSGPSNLTEFGGNLYFSADDGTNGRELWTSNGTSGGTTLLKDLNPSGSGNPTSFARGDDALYFVASAGGSFNQIWKTDGSTAGTSAITGFTDTVEQVVAKSLISVGGNLFYQAVDRVTGFSQVVGNETSGAMTVLKDLIDGPLNVSISRVVRASDGKLYFVAGDTLATGRELYVSDGTVAGTSLVRDINTTGSSSPTELVDANGTIYFAATTSTSGRELWKSDGSASGTTLVKDINAGAFSNSNPNTFATLGSLVFFNATSGASSNFYQSAGDAGSTAIVQSSTGTALGPANDPVVYNGFLYFGLGSQLWRTNGTSAGTTMIKDIGSGSVRFLTNAGGLIYFQAQDSTHGKEVWVSNGTLGGTTMLADINTNASPFNSSSPGGFTAVGSTVYFFADDGTHGVELWKTNGTPGGTSMVADLATGLASSQPLYLTGFNGFLYFTADDGVHGRELWRTDGTTTVMVKDLIAGATGSNPTELTVSGGRLYFAADDGVRGTELWATDGTQTYRVADLNPGAGSSSPMNLTNVNGTLFFTANDGAIGPRLFMLAGDLTPPSASTPTYDVDTPSVSVTFSEDVTHLDVNDVELLNVDTGVPVDSSLLDLSNYDPATHTATFIFPGFARGELPDGNYRLTLKGIDIDDLAGNSMPQDVSVDFYSLAADGKRDRVVDLLDFNLLAANFGKSGISFSKGNYDRSEDGLVTILDFNILASHFGKSVPQPAQPTSASSIFISTSRSSAQLEQSSDLLQSVGLL